MPPVLRVFCICGGDGRRIYAGRRGAPENMELNQIPADVQHCLDTLRKAGFAAYPVGGCVRDLLLGRVPGDYDVCTSALPEQVTALFPHTAPTGVKHGTITVLGSGGAIEVTTFRREEGYSDGRRPDRVSFCAGLTEDLSRRDFTINAMALGPAGEVIDPFGGQADLSAGCIRCVGDAEQRFSEDALRMLRAVRFGAQLGFDIHPDTLSALQHQASWACRVSRERIKAEMEKILLSPRPERAETLLRLGLLEHLYPVRTAPDLTDLRALPPAPGPRWRGFCAATGFPITALPVERALRRAVLHPEEEVLRQLDLSGGQLVRLGLRGPEIGQMQRRLARYVLEHPEDNRQKRLLELAAAWLQSSVQT